MDSNASTPASEYLTIAEAAEYINQNTEIVVSISELIAMCEIGAFPNAQELSLVENETVRNWQIPRADIVKWLESQIKSRSNEMDQSTHSRKQPHAPEFEDIGLPADTTKVSDAEEPAFGSRLWSWIAALAVVVTIVGGLVQGWDSAGNIYRVSQPTRTPIPTNSPTSTPRPTETPLPTDTPIPVPTAAIGEQEILILLAAFDKPSGNHLSPDREWEIEIKEALGEQYPDINARVERIPEVVKSEAEARTLSDIFQATLVIWGRVRGPESGIVEAFYTATPRWSHVEFTPQKSEVIGSLDDITMYVIFGGDTDYVVAFIMAQINFFAGDYQGALPLLTQVISEASPERQREMGLHYALFYRGYVYYQDGDFENAYEDYSASIDVGNCDETCSIAYLNRGVVLREQGNNLAALEDFDKAIELNEGLSIAYSNRASLLAVWDRYEEMRKDAQTAIELDESNATAYMMLGVALTYLQGCEEAIPQFEMAVQLGRPIALYNLGYCFNQQGDYQKAIQSYLQCEEDCPLCSGFSECRVSELSIGHLYLNMNSSYSELHEYEKARDIINKAIEIEPEFGFLYNNRGYLNATLGNYEAALLDYDRSIEVAPMHTAGVFINRGDTFRALGKLPEAITDYWIAIALAPEPNPYVYSNLASVLLETGERCLAMGLLQHYHSHSVDTPDESIESLIDQNRGLVEECDNGETILESSRGNMPSELWGTWIDKSDDTALITFYPDGRLSVTDIEGTELLGGGTYEKISPEYFLFRYDFPFPFNYVTKISIIGADRISLIELSGEESILTRHE